jgi:hypothetical protein
VIFIDVYYYYFSELTFQLLPFDPLTLFSPAMNRNEVSMLATCELPAKLSGTIERRPVGLVLRHVAATTYTIRAAGNTVFS